jgi:hypothetical protein
MLCHFVVGGGLLDTAESQDPYSFKSQTVHWPLRKLQQGSRKRNETELKGEAYCG